MFYLMCNDYLLFRSPGGTKQALSTNCYVHIAISQNSMQTKYLHGGEKKGKIFGDTQYW